jgi:hypothetical protein
VFETEAPQTALPRLPRAEATAAIPADSQHQPGQPRPGEIFARMAAVMADIGAVGKDRQAPAAAGGYAFRGIDDMYNAVQPAMVKNGVFCTPQLVRETVEKVQTAQGKPSIHVVVVVDHVFHAPDGSNVTTTTIGEALDLSDKAANKAMSAAFKYALMQTFCIPVEGGSVDSEQDHHEIGSGPAPAARPAAAAPAKAAPPAKNKIMGSKCLEELDAMTRDLPNKAALQAGWCKHFNVATMNDLTTEQVRGIAAKVLSKITADMPNLADLEAGWCAHFKVKTMSELTTGQIAAIALKAKKMIAAAAAEPREPGQEG